MRKIYSLFALIITCSIFAQTVIFAENFGSGQGSTNPTIPNYTGYQNGSPIAFSGTADIRVSAPSENYTGASGAGCAYFGAVTTDNGLPEKNLVINGIDTSDYENLVLSFGHQKSTNAGSNQLTVEISENGTSWQSLTYTRPTGSGTSNWILITPSGNIPSTENLWIRFNNPRDSNVGFRVDDITLKGTLKDLAVTDNANKSISIYPTQITDGKLYIKSENSAAKKVSIYDFNGKLLINTSATKELDVSKLTTGLYLVNITDGSQTLTQKILVK